MQTFIAQASSWYETLVPPFSVQQEVIAWLTVGVIAALWFWLLLRLSKDHSRARVRIPPRTSRHEPVNLHADFRRLDRESANLRLLRHAQHHDRSEQRPA